MTPTIRSVSTLAALALLAAGCGLASASPNQLCLQYGGGISEDRQFKQVIPPGTNNQTIDAGDGVYCYPNDQRTYRITSRADEGDSGYADSIEVATSSGATVQLEAIVNFKLTQDPELLQRFHNDVGLRTGAWYAMDQDPTVPDPGWAAMLTQYFRPALNTAASEVARRYTVDQLATGQDEPAVPAPATASAVPEQQSTRAEFERAIAMAFKSNLIAGIGGDYFCAPSYTGVPRDDAPPPNEDDSVDDPTGCGDLEFRLERVIAPPAVLDNYARLEAALIAEETARRQIDVAAQERQAIQSIVDVVGPEVYACLEAYDAVIEANNRTDPAAPKIAPPPCLTGAAGGNVLISPGG